MGGKNKLFTEGSKKMEVVTTTASHPGVLNFRISDDLKPEPKMIKSSLDYVTGMFIMKVERQATDEVASTLWHYYPLKVSSERKGNFYGIEVSPAILGDGYVCIDNQVIYVPVGDLVRRHINVTRAVATRSESTTTNTAVSNAIAPSTRRDSVQSSPSITVEPEIRQAIDMACQDQIDSLHYLENCEEGTWEIPNPSQPR